MEKVSHDDKRDRYREECVLCQRKVSIGKRVDISLRNYYVEGVGQLCQVCYLKAYGDIIK